VRAASDSQASLSASRRWGGIFDLGGLRHTVDRLTNLSLSEGFWDDPKSAQKMMSERASAEETLETLLKSIAEVEGLIELLEMVESEGDDEMAEEVAQQLPELEGRVRALEMKRMLGEGDDLPAIVTVNSGAGGTDAEDWAELLLRMYLRYAEAKGFKTELLDRAPGGTGGISSATFVARGPYAYGFLRAEHGVHRLIRVSKFSGRRETSFAAVRVVPELDDEIEVEVRPEDLKITVMRSGGAGGQHVNRTESAVRIEHLPTGFVVRVDQERSQHQNREHAMRAVRGFLFEKARREQEEAFQEAFLSGQNEIGFGRQDRTYTMHPYTLVKDERTGHKETNVDRVLDGDIDPFIEAFLLASADKREQESKKGGG